MSTPRWIRPRSAFYTDFPGQTAIIRKSHSRSRAGSMFSASPPNTSVDLPRVSQALSHNGTPMQHGRHNSAGSSVFLPSEVSFVTSAQHSAHHHSHGTPREEPSMHQLLSADRLPVTSPKASRSVEFSEEPDLTKATVTRFNVFDFPTSSRSSRRKKKSTTATHTTTTTGSSSSLPANPPPPPAIPQPALVSNGDSHIPVLNLPTPSLHVTSRYPFGNGRATPDGLPPSRTPIHSRSNSGRVQISQRPSTAPSTTPEINRGRQPHPTPVPALPTQAPPSDPPPADSEDLILEKSPLPPSDDRKS